ncbi:hypothetical protein INT47_013201 [Mucor saturninus]|uniref:tRNA (guanine(37)-N1)-methyltransferase n=1 Tax=Mucor saturninus TaxID=64648 RepID=A0A8H7V0U3_9FUNG|nr:hypothetical protein INT47_013201 [Mucor saturninus]
MTKELIPPQNRGMTVLDRDAFKKKFHTLAIRVPTVLVKKYTTELEDKLLNAPRIRSVVADGTSNDSKLILLSMDVQDIEVEGCQVVPYEFELDYDYWTTEQILYSVMPEGDAETPSSFTATGHIAHVNLKQENIPFKSLIAQVILDKNKKIKSVVNKTNAIDNTYRNFQMELLAGPDMMITELAKNECRFKFDFSKVYWNSRLQAEHCRNQKLGDVMAGVGPFSIPAAKKGAFVYANDLNPSSYQWLCENIRLNKLSPNTIHTYNMDGRAFIRKAVAEVWADKLTFQHFVMNLPATAIEFLDAFKGAYYGMDIPVDKLPMIHCYCFTKSGDATEDIQQRVCQILGGPIDAAFCNMQMYHVRTVAPKKDMYCISFRLSPEVAFQQNTTGPIFVS